MIDSTGKIELLNLGCGTKTSDLPGVVNIDWSVYLRIRRNWLLRALAPIAIRGERWERFNKLPDNIRVHNLAKGIPFQNGSVDVVYHSHLLEHLDRHVAHHFVTEAKRVLRPNGVVRIVVPDFEVLCRHYLEHVEKCDTVVNAIPDHDNYFEMLIGHCVRREVLSTSQQPPLLRFLENMVLGDARSRGDTHQWMYDRHNMRSLLENAGFRTIVIQNYNSSLIPGWNSYGLDVDASGNEYKPNSLYVEAIK